MNAGVFLTVTRRVCRVQRTCWKSLALSHAARTFVRSRRVRRPRGASRRPATPPVYPAPDQARVAAVWPLVRFSTRRAVEPPSYSSATSLRLASVSPSI